MVEEGEIRGSLSPDTASRRTREDVGSSCASEQEVDGSTATNFHVLILILNETLPLHHCGQ